MRKIGAGIIGLQQMGETHLKGYLDNSHTEVVGICDTDKKQLEGIKEKYQVPFATMNYKELITRDDIGIITIVTPDFLHAEQSIAALKAGKDVLCEKPLTLTLPESKAIIETVKETKRKFMVGQVCRFAPGFVLTKKLVEQGEIGELFFVESEYAHNYTKLGGVGNWRKDPLHLRPPFLGGACHAVDLLRWIAGDMEEVFAYSNHKCLPDWPLDDCTIACYKFKRNIIGKVFCSIGCVRPYTMRSVFYGTKGTIISDNTSPQIQVYSKKLSPDTSKFSTIPVDISSHNVSAEVDLFVESILSNKPLEMDAVEGAKTVAACLAAVESSQKHRVVKIPKF